MKTRWSSKERNESIRYESELKTGFRDLIQEDQDLQWEYDTQLSKNAGGYDRIRLSLDGKLHPFRVEFELKPSLRWLTHLKGLSNDSVLVVAPALSERVLDHCKKLKLSAIDLNGRAWLRGPGLLVDRKALPGRSFSYELEPRNIFVGKSERIVRILLTDIEKVWTQAEVVERSGASSGLVSRIFAHLTSLGYLEKIRPREYRVVDHLSLLDEWARADALPERAKTFAYSGLTGSPIQMTTRLLEWSRNEGTKLAFTQWIAAWLRHPFTEPLMVSAYVDQLPENATLEKFGLKRVSEGGKLWIHLPQDNGVLDVTQQVNGISLVTDAQIYLDLQRTGLRGPDAANALREWEYFCTPKP